MKNFKIKKKLKSLMEEEIPSGTLSYFNVY